MPSSRFDLATLRIFVAVAQRGSISAAGARENIAVSAVSKRISDLELSLGTKLLRRRPRGVDLTPAGAALLHHAQDILRSLDTFEGELSDYVRGAKGHVRMAVNMSSAVQFLPEDLKHFSSLYPDIKIDLQEALSGEVVAAVAEGRAEIGIFTAGWAATGNMRVYAYRSDHLAIIVPRDHVLAVQEAVTFAEVLDETIVGVNVGSAWHAIMEGTARRLGRALKLRFRLSGFDAMCRLVDAGLGVGIAPPAMLGAYTAAVGLVGVPLDEPWACRQIMIATREPEEMSMSARLMLEHLTPP